MSRFTDFLSVATGAWYLASVYDQHVARKRNREVADRDAKIAERDSSGPSGDAKLADLETRLAKLERKGKGKGKRS